MSQLRTWRQRRGFSQRQLGKYVGVTGNAISQFERGIVKPRVQLCKALAQTLDMEFDLLFTDLYGFTIADDAAPRIADGARARDA